MKSKAGFLSLAEELQSYILSFLPCQDILRCTSVCKALHQMYMSSSDLQYIVELSGQCLIPVPNTDNLTPVSERLQLLRDRAHAWLKFDIHSFKTIAMPEIDRDHELYFTGGHFYFWRDISRSATIFPALSEPSQQTIERDWPPGTLCTVPHSKVLEVFMDSAQNLIAVVYIDNRKPEMLYIDLGALDSDRVHPLAAGQTLFACEPLKSDDNNRVKTSETRVKVCGRHIALQHYFVLLDDDEVGKFYQHMSQLQIWDWQHSTTSRSVLSHAVPFPHINPTDFCFLESNRLLVIIKDLMLYSIEDTSRAPQLLACFLLPVPLWNVRCFFQMDAIERSPQQARRTTYTSDPTKQLLCVTASRLVFIISTRVFDLDGKAAAMSIPWNRWGPSNTRVLKNEDPRRCKINVCGNRILQSFNGDTRMKLRMMDFSPLAVTNRRGLGRVVKEPSTVDIADFNCEPLGSLTTSLPYVEVVSDRLFDGFQDIWVNRDGIHLLNLIVEWTGVGSDRRPSGILTRLEAIDI
jgi:hypothetical protein